MARQLFGCPRISRTEAMPVNSVIHVKKRNAVKFQHHTVFGALAFQSPFCRSGMQ